MSNEQKWQDFQLRVADEHRELLGRIARLNAFLESDGFKGLAPAEQIVLTKQKALMNEYDACLIWRLKRWGLPLHSKD